MRAVVLEDFGQWVLTEVADPPAAGPGEVALRLVASALNPSDWKLGDGWYGHLVEYRFPMRLGRDYVGLVESIGPSVTWLEPGDVVFGHVPVDHLGINGTFAERIVLPEESCMSTKPPEMSDAQAAVIPVAVLTAMDCVDFVAPSAGETVVVVGSTGGVGTVAVQLLVRRGAKVIATGLPEEEAYLCELGAVDIVDFRGGTPTLVAARYPGGVDHLVDMAGSDEEFAELASLVRRGGRIASTLSRAEGELLPKGVVGRDCYTSHDRALLDLAGRLVAEGELRVPIARNCTLDELPGALHSLRDHPVHGKIAVLIETVA